MAFPVITTAPTAPTRSMSNDDFIAAADAFVAWMATLDDQLNALSTAYASFGALLGVSGADAELSAIAGLASAAGKGIEFTGSGTAALFTLTTAGKALIDDADAAAQRTTLGMTANGSSLVTAADYSAMKTLLSLVIGTNVQAFDADLTSIAALTTTSFGRSFLELADAAAGRALISAVAASIGVTVLASSISASSGYIKFGMNGTALITIQWVDASIGANTNSTVSYPTPFTSWSRAWCAGSSFNTASGDNPPACDPTTANTTGVSVYNGIASSKNTTVYAWGV